MPNVGVHVTLVNVTSVATMDTVVEQDGVTPHHTNAMELWQHVTDSIAALEKHRGH